MMDVLSPILSTMITFTPSAVWYAKPLIVLLFCVFQRVRPLHLLHREQVPHRQLLLAQPAGRGLHHPHTQALFLQLHHGASGVA